MARHCYIFLFLIVLDAIGCTSAFQSGFDGIRQTWIAGRLISPTWSGGRSRGHGPPFVSKTARTLPGGLHTNPRRVDSRCNVLAAMPKVSDEEMEDRKEQLRDLLCATKAEIDELVRSNPSVLERRDIVKSHGPKVAMLQERLGINEKAACRMCLSSNRLLCASLENLESTMNWLQERLNLSEPQLRTIIGRAPGILTRSIEDNLQPSLEIIQSCLNLSDKEVTKLIVRQPGLLLSFLENLLNTEEDDLATLRKAIMGNPLVLFWSEETMLGIQQWMKNRLGLGDAKIAQMCRNSPQILTMKVATLEEKVDWAQAAMSLSDEELCELFGQFPSLFGYDPVQKLQPKLRYLRKRLNLDDQGLKDLVTK